MVLIDGGDGVAEKAAGRLAHRGYTAVHVLAGGVAAWSAQYPLFPSNNVPSKAFAEIVEIGSHTPHVTAAELHEMQQAGRNLKILDSRTVEEFNRFHVPGAQTKRRGDAGPVRLLLGGETHRPTLSFSPGRDG